MPRGLRLARVRVEWMPVQMYGLGHLGFDHLQLVFEPGEAGAATQDDWFVMEGVREATSDGTFLGIEGPTHARHWPLPPSLRGPSSPTRSARLSTVAAARCPSTAMRSALGR